MRRQKVTLEQQEENTRAFLQKLESIKESSKKIKDRSKLAVHKAQWAKEFKHLERVERNLQADLTQECEFLDRFFSKEMEEYQIFGREQYKTFSELDQHVNNKVDTHGANLWYQLDSLRTIVGRSGELNLTPEKMTEIGTIKNEVGQFLLQICEATNQEATTIGSIEFPSSEATDGEQYMGVAVDEVKGFDLGKDIRRRIKESQNNLESLLMIQERGLEKDEEAKLANQFRKAMGFLQERFNLQIEKLELDYEEALAYDSDVLRASDNYARMNHIYNSYIGRGKDRGLYFERLALEFPKISRKTLELLTNFIEAKIYKTRKLKALERDYWRSRVQLVDKADQQITMAIQQKLEAAKRQAEYLQRRDDSLKISDQLQQFRQRVEQKKQQKLKQEQQKAKLEQQERKKEQKLWKEHAEEIKNKNQQFQQEKEKERMMMEKKANEEIQQERNRRNKLLMQSKPKVAVRQSAEHRKIISRLENKEKQANQGKVKEERLERAIQNYQHVPNVPRDPARLVKHTESLLSKKVEYDKADKIELVKVHGYSVNQLMTDMRYRLGAALQDAGLGGTDYARQVLVQMSKPEQK